MELKTIETVQCKCVVTGKPIDCHQCVNSVMDTEARERLNRQKGIDHTPLKSLKNNGCNMIPLAIETEFKKVSKQYKKKYHKKQEGIKTTIKCDCGLRIRLPLDKKEIKCQKCTQVFALKYDKKNNKERWMRVISCDCGNHISYGKKVQSLKCFKCNHYYDRIEGKWIKQEISMPRDQMTMGDLIIKIRKKK